MGLLAVSKFIKTKYPHLYHTEHLSLFAHHRVFMDIASYVYKYVCIMGANDSKWLNSFVNLCLAFRRNGVILTVVFDGQAPQAKADEQKARRDMRAKQVERTDQLKEALEAYQTSKASGSVASNDITNDHKCILQKELENYNRRKDIYKEPIPASAALTLTTSEVAGLHELIKSLSLQTSSLSSQDFTDLKTVLTACGICWLQAPAEAEAFCSWLVRANFGTAVVSCDTDCLAHRADVVIFEVDVNSGMIKYVNTKELLDEWQLTEHQLMDFGILCGCDYNPNSRVNKIGPATALQLLQKYGDIDKMPIKSTLEVESGSSLVGTKRKQPSGPMLTDVDCLQHKLIRELFNPSYDDTTVEKLQYIEPDFSLLTPVLQRRPDVNQQGIQELIQCVKRKPSLKIEA